MRRREDGVNNEQWTTTEEATLENMRRRRVPHWLSGYVNSVHKHVGGRRRRGGGLQSQLTSPTLLTDSVRLLLDPSPHLLPLLAPALELCFAVYSNAASASPAVLALLNAHQDVLTNVLKAVLRDVVTLSQINLAQLLVTLLSLRVADQSRASVFENGAFHSHVLGAAAAFLMSENWRTRVVPSNDGERDDLSAAAGATAGGSGAGNRSFFCLGPAAPDPATCRPKPLSDGQQIVRSSSAVTKS